MTTTLQQMIAEPEALLARAQRGEEIVLTDGGKPVVRLTGVRTKSEAAPQQPVAQSTDEPVAAKMGPRKAAPGAIRDWITKARAAAAAAATGKRGMTADEIIDDLRSERC